MSNKSPNLVTLSTQQAAQWPNIIRKYFSKKQYTSHGPLWLNGFVCTFHPAVPGLNSKHAHFANFII